MPSATFENLDPVKQQAFVQAALQEFALHPYEEASLNRLAKQLGIAKGSIYRYFTDKQDLHTYLRQYATQKKRNLIEGPMASVGQNHFWAWLEALFMGGLQFTLQYPLCSALMLRYEEERPVQDAAQVLEGFEQEGLTMLSQTIAHYQKLGQVSTHQDPLLMAGLIVQSSRSLYQLFKLKYAPQIKALLAQGQPLSQLEAGLLQQHVKDTLSLLKHGFNPQQP